MAQLRVSLNSIQDTLKDCVATISTVRAVKLYFSNVILFTCSISQHKTGCIHLHRFKYIQINVTQATSCVLRSDMSGCIQDLEVWQLLLHSTLLMYMIKSCFEAMQRESFWLSSYQLLYYLTTFPLCNNCGLLPTVAEFSNDKWPFYTTGCMHYNPK